MEKYNVHIVGAGLEYCANEKEWIAKTEDFNLEVDESLGDVIIDFVAEKEVALDLYSKMCAKDPKEVINLYFKDENNNTIAEYINDNGEPFKFESVGWDEIVKSREDDDDE